MRKQEKRKLKVLIVEDEQDILTLFTEYLSDQGHQVVSCYLNANDILRDFEKNKPDVCLIDYALPGDKNGIDGAVDIFSKDPSMPVLFITGHESKKEDLLKHPILRDKNIEFLVKPVRLHQLEIAVLDIVNKKRTPN
jgi:DNA-binding NtrC family response regulator